MERISKMKFFVTGVNGQLGHDVMNELSKRGHEGVGSDLGETYAGVQDGSAVTTMPYVSLDITDQAAVKKQIMEIKPDAVIHCAAWTAVDAAEDEDKQATVKKVMWTAQETLQKCARRWTARCCTSQRIMYLMDRARRLGSRIAKITSRSMSTDSQSWTENWQFLLILEKYFIVLSRGYLV